MEINIEEILEQPLLYRVDMTNKIYNDLSDLSKCELRGAELKSALYELNNIAKSLTKDYIEIENNVDTLIKERFNHIYQPIINDVINNLNNSDVKLHYIDIKPIDSGYEIGYWCDKNEYKVIDIINVEENIIFETVTRQELYNITNYKPN